MREVGSLRPQKEHSVFFESLIGGGIYILGNDISLLLSEIRVFAVEPPGQLVANFSQELPVLGG
jgi:hypothetical protein